MRRHSIAALPAVAALLCLVASAASAAAGTESRRLTSAEAQRINGTHVIVCLSALDEDDMHDVVKRVGAGSIVLASGVMVGSSIVYASTLPALATSQYAIAAPAGIVAAAPLAIIMGGGALIGGSQQRSAEAARAHAITDPIRAELIARHEREQLDGLLLEAIDRELGTLPWLRQQGSTMVLRERPDRPGSMDGFDEALDQIEKPEGAILVIWVRKSLPEALTGLFVVAEARLYSPSENRERGVGKGWRRRPIFRSAETTMILSPIPVQDIFVKPAAWIEPREREVQEHYGTLIESSAIRDTRRELKVRRNAELDDIKGPWQLLQLSEHMAEAWRREGAEGYSSLVGSGFDQLAQTMIADLGALDPAPATSAASGSRRRGGSSRR